MDATLNRTTFKTSRMLDYFSERELVAQTGHSLEWWGKMVVKELTDNSLDACETAEVAARLWKNSELPWEQALEVPF